MRKIEVNIPGKSAYEILSGRKLFADLNKVIKRKKLTTNIAAVVDQKVYKLYKRLIDTTFAKFNKPVIIIKLKATEELKTFDSLQKIYSALQKAGYTRDTLLLAVGGGIIGDITGFAAATYNRGIKYVQIPTTLLAVVDSSVGGKTGVNFGNVKNSIGAFYQPEFVLVDTQFFSTLPKNEILCGIGEVVKYGFLIGDKFNNYFYKNIEKSFRLDSKVIYKLIRDSISFKKDVVTNDEKEHGLRKILNLGHTFAHAFEVEQKYRIKHGAAVILGIACSLFLSNQLGLLDKKNLDRYKNNLKHFSSKIKIKSADKNLLYKIMLRDKKNFQNRIKFVLMGNSGKIYIDVEADRSHVYFAIDKGLKLFR